MRQIESTRENSKLCKREVCRMREDKQWLPSSSLDVFSFINKQIAYLRLNGKRLTQSF